MASQSQKDKEQFFADLYALDVLVSEDDEIITPTEDNIPKPWGNARRGFKSSDPRSTRSTDRSSLRLDTRVAQTRDETSVNGETAEKARLRDSGRPEDETQRPSRLIKSNTAPEVTSISVQPPQSTPGLRRTQTEEGATPRASRRARKKGPDISQIFAGQTFFFIPNDNRAVPRKRRIDKAILHGARWARAWTPSSVTHVIVESDRTLRDVAKVIGEEHLPANIALLRDTWLTESLSYKEMRDITARRFQMRREKQHENLRHVMDVQQDSFEEHVRSSSTSEEPTTVDFRERPRDVLGYLCEEARATQHLPLDLDSETTSAGSFTDSEKSFAGVDSEVNKGFQCMLKNDEKTLDTNPNAATMGILQEMASLYDRMGNQWRTLSCRKAITALRKQTSKVETKEQARAIPQIGERLADKIEEIVSTNKLRRLDSAKSDPDAQVMQLFMGIYGVGPAVASKWIAQGHRTLQDVGTKVDLTSNMRIGLEHYADFAKNIPRAEVVEHARIIQETLRNLDPSFQLIVGGSYRRGKSESGDIDCLITKEGASIEHIRSILMESVIPYLTRTGFLKATLASTHSRGDGSKWHGVSALPNIKVWRRIDLLFVPWDELGAALIYFTGNDIFNRSIRLLASKRGMRLNQHGLYKDVMRGNQRERITEGTLVEGHSEQKILETLGVPWRPPQDRNC